MRYIAYFLVVVLALLVACAPGAAPEIPTGVPPSLATGAAQAPTLAASAANTAAAAVGTAAPSAGTAAAGALQTAVPAVQTAAPSAGTEAAGAVQTAAPAVQTAAPSVATAAAGTVQTAVPPAQTLGAAAQTAIATPLSQLPGAATPAPGANVVQVKESEYKIDMPTSLPAGSITFHVTNAGTTQHSLEIQGQGVDVKLDNPLNPGDSKDWTVNLAAGSYKVFCPIDGHKDLGMQVDLMVTP